MTRPLSTQESPLLAPRRRDILMYGGALALLPRLSWAGEQQSESIAIGYCPELPSAEDLDHCLLPRSVVAATRLDAGEARLARRETRITVHGLFGTGRLSKLGIRAAELRVRFPVASVDASEVEFQAWSHQILPVENVGSANAFTVPIDRGLQLALELDTAMATQRFETLLVTDSEPGAAKLRSGFYLIAPGATAFRAERFDPTGPEPLIALSVQLLDDHTA